MNHGTIKLITCIAIIIGFQVLIALPFSLFDESSVVSGAGRIGVAGDATFSNYLVGLSIFWTFIPEEVYFNKEAFSDKVKIGMVAANIWHFFFRKWALVPCFQNLFATFDFKKTYGITTHEQLRKTLEILLIGYISGIVLMPGAN